MPKLWRPFIFYISPYFRRKRSRLFRLQIPNLKEMNVCDLGGSFHFWESIDPDIRPDRLTIINIADDNTSRGSPGSRRGVNATFVIYDGKRIPFGDKHFDVLICNSVIEHVPANERCELMRECRRVSRYLLIQTPAYIFPIEQHFVSPFIHWLPRPLARKLWRFGLWNLLTSRSREAGDRYFDEVHLLTLKEFRSYVPDLHLYTEFFLFVPKSYTLYGSTMSDYKQWPETGLTGRSGGGAVATAEMVAMVQAAGHLSRNR